MSIIKKIIGWFSGDRDPSIEIIQTDKIQSGEINSHTYKKFIIPIKDISKEEQEKAIQSLIENYSTDVYWDEEDGELKYSKRIEDDEDDMWFPTDYHGI